jgi:hypothetical protein
MLQSFERRRICFYEGDERLIGDYLTPVIESCPEYFVVLWDDALQIVPDLSDLSNFFDLNLHRKCLKDGTTCFFMPIMSVYEVSAYFKWKPFEYVQEVSKVTLYILWMLNRCIGMNKDESRIVAKMVFASRWDVEWEKVKMQ